MEFRVFGPPGTGKTTRLATRDIPRAIEKYGSENVMVTSFTKAAAKEISFKKSRKTGHKISIKPENVGTMHSILYHAMQMPTIMEVHYIDEWNAKHPMHQIKGGKVQNMDESCSTGSSVDEGDRLLNAINIKRNKLIPMKMWSDDQNKFYELWCKFKNEADAVDFTDLIEKGYNEFEKAPGEPNVIFVDEAQDFTQLQLSCIRKWGKHAEWIILVGDDDQTIFEFTGADPTAFLMPPIDNKYKTVLGQSWRVPRAILDRALNVIQRITFREKKQYLPRMENDNEAQGEVVDLDITYNHADHLVDMLEPYLAKDMTVKILGSCSYMLEPVKKELRKRALPFHNKYRRRRKDWNPLYGHGTINEFFEAGLDEEYWNIPQFVSWAKYLKVGDGTTGLKKKTGKKVIKRLQQAILDNEDGLHTCREILGITLTDVAIKAALARDVDWYMANIPSTKQKILEYQVKVFKKHGAEGLEEEPKITIGTIHSVKGAEADVVVLFPDVSYLADIEMGTIPGMDSAHRLFYVGMTRAKHSLLLTRPIVLMSKRYPRMYVQL